jgi:myosin heavy subunit
LEKTRITKQVDGERNYHVFYQLLAGAEPEMLTDFGLDVNRAASLYSYLGCREGAPEMSDHDGKGYEETCQCLQSIGLSLLQQKNVFSIVAAVLHLGNIQFETNGDDDNHHHEGDHAKIKGESAASLQKACELLGVDEAKLSEALLTKSLNVNGKTIKKRQNVAMAEDKRDALAKLTYSSLFLWLVKRVNETLNQTSSVVTSPKKEQADKGFIGVLDIYGFECFETNGYEQLLINYCNEKLQRHFNRHLFEVEQQIYVNEGVDWTYITFNDNRPCLELIEGGGGCVGILNTLDDAWGGMGTATEKDTKFVTHLHKLFGPVETKKDDDDATGGGHKNYTMPKFGNDRQFIIVHYAGEVRMCSRWARFFTVA